MKINAYSRPITTDYSNNPANKVIDQKMSSQERGLDQGIDNANDAQNLLNTAEGALNSVGDSLNRIRTLAVEASNGTLTDDDRSIIQNEINAIREGISDNLRNTEFNQISLFDGFEGQVQTGANAGQNRNIQIENTSLENLGIADFDVTEDFDISQIDNAIERVSEARSNIGSQSNALENNIQSNAIARENTLSAQSQLDEDIVEKVNTLRRDQLLEQYSIQMQRKNMNNQQNIVDSIF